MVETFPTCFLRLTVAKGRLVQSKTNSPQAICSNSRILTVLERPLAIVNAYFDDIQINRWLHSSRSLWEIHLCCNLFRKRIDQKNFFFTATNNWIELALQWSVKYFFAPNSLLFRKSSKEEDKQFQRFLLFKKTQKLWNIMTFYMISFNMGVSIFSNHAESS